MFAHDKVMFELYREAGYDLVELPRAPVSARLRFLLETVAARVLPGDPLIGAALGRLGSGRLQ